jgi:hypothetical protein
MTLKNVAKNGGYRKSLEFRIFFSELIIIILAYFPFYNFWVNIIPLFFIGFHSNHTISSFKVYIRLEGLNRLN